jgi:hypothetical protein
VLVPLLVLGVHRVRRDPDIAGYGAVTVHLPIAGDGVEVAMDRHHPPEAIEELRDQANAMAIELMDRAKSAGALRPEVVGEDLLLLLIANAAVLTVTRRDAPAASRRVVALFLDAVRTEGPVTTLPDPPTSTAMYRAMTRMAATRGCASPEGGEPDAAADYGTTSHANEGNG